ncbi:transcription and mRNA export factor ENY2 isoform X2 [Rousettus aegyptiacus]|nr:transcription and mRNA export factor ENY2 isoform X2 [Rousettus aegyptiacus]
MNKDAQMRAAINQKLIETGERERLKELLRAKLIECGWKDQLKAHCKEVIKEKGLEHVTVDDLVAEITPKGREFTILLEERTFANWLHTNQAPLTYSTHLNFESRNSKLHPHILRSRKNLMGNNLHP